MRVKIKKLVIILIIICTLILIIPYIHKEISPVIRSSLIIQQTSLILSNQNVPFDINKNVLVFVHIQKTGGSDFDRNIVKHLLIKKGTNKWTHACENILNRTSTSNNKAATTKSKNKKKVKFKKFICHRESIIENNDMNWYFSRQTFGWICGLHPYYTELRDCVKNFYPVFDISKFFYFTILRDPLRRYISEWQHVKRGATWRRTINKQCSRNDHDSKCYQEKNDWQNVTLQEFISCKYNMANNRQTRMLAYFDTTCNYHMQPLSTQHENNDLLKRALKTLNSMSFFAINEYQHLSQKLFEKTFGKNLFKFEIDLYQSNKTIADAYVDDLLINNNVIIEKIRELNSLDIKLYEYAKTLFFKKLDQNKILKI